MDNDINSKIAFEQWKMEHASNLAKYDAENSANLEMFRSVISSAHTALKSVVLINSGAAVALLAFVGSTWSRSIDFSVIKSLLISMVFFVVGVVLGGTATGLTYFAQYSYASKKEKTGDRWRKAIIASVFCAYVLFIIGCVISLLAFWNRPAVITS